MPGSEPDHSKWARIDAADDPQEFVRFLDTSRAQILAAIRANPAAAYAWLNLEPGLSVLDIGSGTGVLLHPLAELLDPTGRVVGIDYSQTMVDEATRRVDGLGLPIEFRQMDAGALTFGDNGFDRVMSNIVFQHLPDPAKALDEMVRVAKPGGLVSVFEQDWETLVIDASDKALTRTIANAFCDAIPEGWMGRQLYGRFLRAGLTDVSISPISLLYLSDQGAELLSTIRHSAMAAGRIGPAEFEAWAADQRARVEQGSFFACFTMFRAVGTKAG